MCGCVCLWVSGICVGGWNLHLADPGELPRPLQVGDVAFAERLATGQEEKIVPSDQPHANLTFPYSALICDAIVTARMLPFP